MDIKDRIFIVTGATSGIGLATAKLLSDEGGKVALSARSQPDLEEVSKLMPGSFVIPADMTEFDSVRAMVAATNQHFGRVDGLINNAGRSYEASVEEIDLQIFDEIYRLNLLGPIVAMQAVIPIMRAQGSGAIVNINSGTALMKIPRYSVYSSSKRALVGISATARLELESDGIVVSQVFPFVTATNFGKNRMGAPGAGGPPPDYSHGDSAEYVAQIILKAILEGEAEYFAHERMRQMENR